MPRGSVPSSAVRVEPRLDAFVSHATEDAGITDLLVGRLQSNGVTLWYDRNQDETGIMLGGNTIEQINAGLRACRCGIIVVSKVYLSKNFTMLEFRALVYRATREEERKILFVLVDLSVDEFADLQPLVAPYRSLHMSEGVDGVVKAIEAFLST